MSRERDLDFFGDRRWCSSRTEILEKSLKAIERRTADFRCWFYSINLYSLGLLEKDAMFRHCYSEMAYATADGVVNTFLHYLKGWPRRERIAGADLFEALVSLGTERRELRCFFFGAKTETLAKIQKRINVEHPNVSVVGCISPPFTDSGISDADGSYVEAINAASPDILFVGLTQPKQERWLNANFEDLTVPVAACIGAVFDFYAGNNRRAPIYIRKLGLEWLIRLSQDPSKIAYRFKYALPVLWRLIRSGR